MIKKIGIFSFGLVHKLKLHFGVKWVFSVVRLCLTAVLQVHLCLVAGGGGGMGGDPDSAS